MLLAMNSYLIIYAKGTATSNKYQIPVGLNCVCARTCAQAHIHFEKGFPCASQAGLELTHCINQAGLTLTESCLFLLELKECVTCPAFIF